MQVLDKLVDKQRTLVVAESDGITCKASLSWLVAVDVVES
jgi:hypothetical protein